MNSSRFRITLTLLLLSFLCIILRLFYWQVVKAAQLQAVANAQYGKSVILSSERGNILSADGFPLVGNKISYLVYANPKKIPEKEQVAQLLSPILQTDPASISAQLSLNRFWVPLKPNISNDVKMSIDMLRLKGIGFEDQYARFYPEASMAAQLLGIVGKNDDGADQGYFGIEGFYDRILKGQPATILQIHDAFGRPIIAKMTGNDEKKSGSSLQLSLDRAIQYIAEKKLKDGIEKYGARAGMVGIMNPKTGEILAMSSFPSFDPNNYRQSDDSLFKNPFITSTYEPGSTFKPLVMASALDANLVKPDTKCPVCAGAVEVGGYAIHTWDDKYFPDTNMIDIMVHSDNTGMVYVAQKLGLDRMLSYLDNFGIGSITGIDLQGEETIPLKSKDNWYAVDLATTGFGQGIAITPMALLSGFSALANDGIRMVPHLVTKVIVPDGSQTEIEPKELSRPISSQTAKVMTEILVQAVNNGEAKWTRLKGYRIAGKTGTASIPIAGHYDPTKTIASFIGFAPADDPKFIMLVILDRPTASIYGAETAAPIFFDITKDILMYYNIPPSE